ncbi:MAG: hypothetical protein KDB61_00145 [Planctomycetes bacterium]|nr:hypothetical protein [Planctomycetota bacterium]
MSQHIMEAPHGINLVVNCVDGTIYIGRFDQCNGFEVLMHDCDVWTPGSGDDDAEKAEHWVRETATYGVDVKHRDLRFDAADITDWTPLGQVPKL